LTCARPSGVPAVPIAVNPIILASWSAAVPTPPDAPCTKTVSPGCALARFCNAKQAVKYGSPAPAPC